MIYVLPQTDYDDLDNLASSERNRIKAAKTSTYRVDSLKIIFDIDYMDLKYLLHYNLEFFDHCIKVADKVVVQMIRTWKKNLSKSGCKEDYLMLKNAKTLNDLLNSCDHFGTNYESRRRAFIDSFVENLESFEEYFQ